MNKSLLALFWRSCALKDLDDTSPAQEEKKLSLSNPDPEREASHPNRDGVATAFCNTRSNMDVHRGAGEATNGECHCNREPHKNCEADAGVQASASGCFDCNICLDFAVEPVVTLCGHLYCWPCIYRWLQQAESAAAQQCPVCKAALSQDTLVPLYGRGHHGTKKSHQGLEIPRRPSPSHSDAIEYLSPGGADEAEIQPQYRHQHQYHNPNWDYMPQLGATRVIHSTAGGVLGGMAVAVLPWIFRNQDWASVYYSSPYYMGGNGSSPRLRRQEMELERSLHQIWVFLCCCAVLCLLLF